MEVYILELTALKRFLISQEVKEQDIQNKEFAKHIQRSILLSLLDKNKITLSQFEKCVKRLEK